MTRPKAYEIGERLSLGGMAEVHRAIAIAAEGGARRDVVLKRILAPFSEDPAYRALFEEEARLGAALKHANVVELLDAGVMDDRLFLALEWVDGVDLAAALRLARRREKAPPTVVSLYIARELLRGLQYVHSRAAPDGKPLNLVHRDVSPGNVLLSHAGQVKLGDLGSAKAIVRSGKTVTGVIKGDAHYMSPEQLSGGTVDARTDVYAVGMLLFTLLAGQDPLEGATFADVVPRILEGKVPPPSSFRRELAGPIDDAIRRAIHPDLHERFVSAIDFQFALEAYAKDRGLALEAAALAEWLESMDARRSRGHGGGNRPVPSLVARIEPLIAEAIEAPPVAAEGGSRGPIPRDPARPEPSIYRTRPMPPDTKPAAPAAKKKGKAPPGGDDEEEDVDTDSVDGLPPPGTAPLPPSARASAAKARSGGSAGASHSLTHTAATKPKIGEVEWFAPHRKPIAALALGPRGRFVVTGSHDQTLCVFDLVLRRAARSLTGHSSAITCLAITPDGGRVVSGGRDKTLRVWRISDGTLLRTIETTAWVFSVAALPDGRRAVSGGLDGKLRVWDLETGKALRALEGHVDALNAIAPLPDDNRVLSGGRDKSLRLWNLSSGQAEMVIDEGLDSVRAVAVSADGTRAVSAGAEPVVRMWDLALGSEVHRFEGHREPVAALAFSPEGLRVLSAGYDGTLRLWSARTGEAVGVFEGHEGAVLAAEFARDGAFFVSGGADGRVGLWPLAD